MKEVLGSIDTHRPGLPLPVQAAVLSSMGQTEQAVLVWERAYAENPTDIRIANEYADALADSDNYEKLNDFVLESPLQDSNKTYYLLRADQNEKVIDLANARLAPTTRQ